MVSKHLFDEVLTFLADLLPLNRFQRKVTINNFVHDFFFITAGKRRVSTQEQKENNTATPDVTLLIHILICKELRTRIVRLQY